jgi:hypothetical protein
MLHTLAQLGLPSLYYFWQSIWAIAKRPENRRRR